MGQFAAKFKELRESRNLSVRALARELDKSPGYISRIEGRGEIPSMDFVSGVASFFEIQVETLLNLLKLDQLAKAEREINQKHEETIQLFRKGTKR
jgi:transcriptional regulator with XRE-family HTH domain